MFASFVLVLPDRQCRSKIFDEFQWSPESLTKDGQPTIFGFAQLSVSSLLALKARNKTHISGFTVTDGLKRDARRLTAGSRSSLALEAGKKADMVKLLCIRCRRRTVKSKQTAYERPRWETMKTHERWNRNTHIEAFGDERRMDANQIGCVGWNLSAYLSQSGQVSRVFSSTFALSCIFG